MKVRLVDTKPPIWRRVLVAGHSTLGDLHEVIQAAFGWWNYHLHEFEIGSDRYGAPDPDIDWDPPLDERHARIDTVARKGGSFRYTYDFGDFWQHKVTVEKVLPAAPDTALPACTGGRRARPPEDCGGTWGYQELVEILAHPDHPEQREQIEWLGRPFDPEAFDPSTFEDNLRTVRLTIVDD